MGREEAWMKTGRGRGSNQIKSSVDGMGHGPWVQDGMGHGPWVQDGMGHGAWVQDGTGHRHGYRMERGVGMDAGW